MNETCTLEFFSTVTHLDGVLDEVLDLLSPSRAIAMTRPLRAVTSWMLLPQDDNMEESSVNFGIFSRCSLYP
jgi:hypothetical protein